MLEAELVALEAVVGKRTVLVDRLIANHDVLTLVHGGGGEGGAR